MKNKAEFNTLYELYTLDEISVLWDMPRSRLYSYVCEVWKIKRHPSGKRIASMWRGRVAKHLKRRGWTLQRMADFWGCTRENVRQYLKRS